MVIPKSEVPVNLHIKASDLIPRNLMDGEKYGRRAYLDFDDLRIMISTGVNLQAFSRAVEAIRPQR